MFENIINPELKKIFTSGIDALLANNALTVECTLRYSGQQNKQFCNNCLFDSISQLSANIYNNTGPNPFPEGAICPICLGAGLIMTDSSQKVYLACLFDSKYFMNNSAKFINITDGYMQTICKIDLISKIRNANELLVDSALNTYGNYLYERAGDPQPMGLGDNKYIITLWKRK